ncbi:type VII secretion protein EccB, partial [Actinoplanes siamensis]
MRDVQLQRLTAALIGHDADPGRPPLRRAGAAVLTGALVAALVAGGLAAYRMVTGGGLADPTDPSVILLDRRSGARYVFLETDRRLHPVLNYTSGLLLAAGEQPEVKPVSQARLARVPLGATLGIPGAPDALPPAENLIRDAWTVCTDRAARTSLLVGAAPPGAPAGERALLVHDPTGRTFLVGGGARRRLPAERAVQWFGRSPALVAAAWIDAVPAGPDLFSPPGPPPAGLADFAVRACVTRPADGPASVRLDPALPPGVTPVPRGRGAVVTATSGVTHVVTDDGRACPLSSRDLLPRLGYAGVEPVTVPAELVALLP